MITVIASLKAKLGQDTLLAQECIKIAREVRKKRRRLPGVHPHTAVDNPAEILFVENYVDRAAPEAQLQTPHFMALAA